MRCFSVNWELIPFKFLVVSNSSGLGRKGSLLTVYWELGSVLSFREQHMTQDKTGWRRMSVLPLHQESKPANTATPSAGGCSTSMASKNGLQVEPLSSSCSFRNLDFLVESRSCSSALGHRRLVFWAPSWGSGSPRLETSQITPKKVQKVLGGQQTQLMTTGWSYKLLRPNKQPHKEESEELSSLHRGKENVLKQVIISNTANKYGLAQVVSSSMI